MQETSSAKNSHEEELLLRPVHLMGETKQSKETYYENNRTTELACAATLDISLFLKAPSGPHSTMSRAKEYIDFFAGAGTLTTGTTIPLQLLSSNICETME